jgi:hypothetical protein
MDSRPSWLHYVDFIGAVCAVGGVALLVWGFVAWNESRAWNECVKRFESMPRAQMYCGDRPRVL